MLRLAALISLVLAVQPNVQAQDQTDTVPPFEYVTPREVRVPATLASGTGLDVPVRITTQSLTEGTLGIRMENSEWSSYLMTLDEVPVGFEPIAGEHHFRWTCDQPACTFDIVVRVDALTETFGDLIAFGDGRAASEELPAGATMRLDVGETVAGPARTFLLADKLYAESGPKADLVIFRWAMGDPSDEIEIAARSVIGTIAADDPATDRVPRWTPGLLVANSTECAPTCTDETAIRAGPWARGPLELQLLAHSERPGVAAIASALAIQPTAERLEGTITIDPGERVVALPISVTGFTSSVRLVAAVDADRGATAAVRPRGSGVFDQNSFWIVPSRGEYELAISSHHSVDEAQEVDWLVAVYTLPEAAGRDVGLEVGDPAPSAFIEGEPGDPNLNRRPDPGISPWAVVLVAAAAVGGGAFFWRRLRSN